MSRVGLPWRWSRRDLAAVGAALAGPLARPAVLLPFRGSWSNTNAALLLVVVVVAVATAGNRAVGTVDVEQSGPPAELELLVFGNGQYYGRFLLTPRPGSKPALQARLVAVALAEQVGHACSNNASAVSAR